jgi:hypothetical protein
MDMQMATVRRPGTSTSNVFHISNFQIDTSSTCYEMVTPNTQQKQQKYDTTSEIMEREKEILSQKGGNSKHTFI